MAAAVIGREPELSEIARALESAETDPVAVVLDGDPGIGKTTVVQEALGRAREQMGTLLSCRPAESEASLPYSALGDLFDEVLDGPLAALSEPQRAALEAALLRVTPSAAVERLAVSRAALALLRALAAAGPVLVAVDDVQWLDAPTADVLEFAARRLDGVPVRLLVARRSDREQPPPLGLAQALPAARLHRLRIGPLSIGDLDLLLRARLDLRLPRPRLVNVHEESGGNPFYALEIARYALEMEVPLDEPGPLPVPASLAELLSARVRAVTPAARDAVLLAAASTRPSAEVVERAAGRSDGLAEAADRGILGLEATRLRFSHPLLASVAYGDAPPWERREAHRRLAATVTDRVERARHLALATDEADDTVATELEEASGLALARGAPEAAAELGDAAIRLTPPVSGDDRRRRLLAAAEHHVAAGDPAHARAMLRDLLTGQAPGPERAETLLRLADAVPELPESIRLCEQAIAEAGDDPGLGASSHTALATFTWLAGDLALSAGHLRSAATLAAEAGDRQLVAISLAELCHAEVVLGRPLPRAEMDRALELEGEIASFPTYLRPSFQLGVISVYTDELEIARPLLRSALDRVRAEGDAARIGVLFRLTELELRAGVWSEALRLAREAESLARQAGIEQEQAVALAALGLVSGHVGLVDEARAAAEAALGLAEALGDRIVACRSRGALGFLELSLGNLDAADAWLAPAAAELLSMGAGELSIHGVAQNQIEVLSGLGRLDEAEQLIEYTEAKGRAAGRAWHEAIAARGRALVASAHGDTTGAREAVERALAAHERLPQPFELARTHLAHGTIERRSKQRRSARDALERALELFDELGAPLWAEKAGAELARIPGRARSDGGLSETERRVAELVADGRSNKEVAAALFVTVRTVEANLTRIYAKLGVRSRGELTRHLAADK